MMISILQSSLIVLLLISSINTSWCFFNPTTTTTANSRFSKRLHRNTPIKRFSSSSRNDITDTTNNIIIQTTTKKQPSSKPKPTPTTTTPSSTYPTLIDHEGRTWHSNAFLHATYSLQRDSIPYLPPRTAIPWRVRLGPGESMLRRKPSKGQTPHFEEDDERWMHHYERLVQYKAEFGHTNVPLRWEEDLTLGQWCNRQRFQYGVWVEHGEKEFVGGKRVAWISGWRIGKLEELGFDFGYYWKWSERLELLKEFRDAKGHLKVRREDEREYPGLYDWMKTQRKEYNAMRRGDDSTGMTLERKKRLDEIGFDWNPRQTAWNDKFEQLVRFKRKYGHCNVPQIQPNQDYDDVSNNSTSLSSLGKWVARQRENYKQLQTTTTTKPNTTRSLTPERIAKLQTLGFQWDPTDANWNTQFQRLKRYKEKHNHCNVPINHPTLGKWVSLQRRHYKTMLQNDSSSSPMTSHRKQQLDTIGFTWDVPSSTWNDNYAKLLRFHDKYNHVNVPHGYDEDPSLWNWVTWQRKQYKLYQNNKPSNMTPDKISRLERLDFRWNIHDDEWLQRFERLRKYKSKYGHCNVPKEYDGSLYTWIQTQRRMYKLFQQQRQKSSMTKERIQKLESINFCWNARDALWMERYEQLKAYKQINGNCRVPMSEDARLGKWVSAQRMQYKKRFNGKGSSSSMTKERMKLLEDLGFEWVVVKSM